jgi:hypothetical protein
VCPRGIETAIVCCHGVKNSLEFEGSRNGFTWPSWLPNPARAVVRDPLSLEPQLFRGPDPDPLRNLTPSRATARTSASAGPGTTVARAKVAPCDRHPGGSSGGRFSTSLLKKH